MNLSVALRLGRVSNVPTVWTNVFTGVALAGAAAADARLAILLVSLSLFYVGGMFLNDAFDSAFDTRSRPERPIPLGQVSAAQVYVGGFAMLAAGVGLLASAGYGFEPYTQWRPVLAGIALAIAITFYNWHHKDNPLSPLVMGVCRLLVYLAAAYAVAIILPRSLFVAAIVLLCYLIGLTYTAKQEHLDRLGAVWPLTFLAVPVAYGIWLAIGQPSALLPLLLFVGWTLYALWLLRRRAKGDVPRAVVSLIAGIALLDSVILAGHGAPLLSGLAVAAFVLTLSLQRWVSGT